MAYSCRTNVFIQFHHFVKKEQTQLKTKQLKQNIFKSIGIYGTPLRPKDEIYFLDVLKIEHSCQVIEEHS